MESSYVMHDLTRVCRILVRNGRALWDELKRLNRGMKCATSTLDGHSINADAVEHLATKYCALFSSQTTTGKTKQYQACNTKQSHM